MSEANIVLKQHLEELEMRINILSQKLSGLSNLETRLTELEQWTRADEDVVYDKLKKLEEHRVLQIDENRAVSKHFDEHKEIGEEWIRLFKKLNSDRMDEILALKTRIGFIEKRLFEPRAQALVDAVGSAYRPIREECLHCGRPKK